MQPTLLLLLYVLLGAETIYAQFSNVGAAACSQILQAGIYNTFSTSTGQSGYSTFQSTMCSDLSSYSYNQYSQQTMARPVRKP